VITILIGGLCSAATFICIPLATTFHSALILALFLGVSNTLLAAAPLSLISDYCSDKDRPQALSLIRVSQDAGFLFGATVAGITSAWFAFDSIVQMQGGVLVLASMLVGSLLRRRKI
jgi:MFS family permease